MRVRRVLGIFLAFVLVFSMAACGNSETSPKQASGGSGSVRTEASKAGRQRQELEMHQKMVPQTPANQQWI